MHQTCRTCHRERIKKTFDCLNGYIRGQIHKHGNPCPNHFSQVPTEGLVVGWIVCLKIQPAHINQHFTFSILGKVQSPFGDHPGYGRGQANVVPIPV